MRRALETSQIQCRLHAVGIGRNALTYLRQSEPFEDAPTPDLILFDFFNPASRHLKWLQQLKNDESLPDIPFVLLTGHYSEQFLEDAIDEREGTMFSPIDLDDFLHAMRSFKADRFLNAVRIIQDIGYVLVRIPIAVETQNHTNQPAAHSG